MKRQKMMVSLVIEPDALDAAIRWGMTAFVDMHLTIKSWHKKQ